MTQQSDEDVRVLLELAGQRHEPPQQVRERVHAAALAEWEQLEQPLEHSQRRWPLAAAALFFVAVTGGLLVNQMIQDSAPVAQIAYQSGTVDWVNNGDQDAQVYPSAQLITGADGFADIRLTDTTSLRVANNTSVRIQNNAAITLRSGKIYIDSPDQRESVTVSTRFGTVTDIGTQFEVQTLDERQRLEVAVREGQINLQTSSQQFIASARNGWGDILQVDARGELSKQRVATTDKRWLWTQDAAGGFDPTNTNVHDYLVWASREIGLELNYVSPLVEARAKRDPWQGSLPISAVDTESVLMAINEGTDTFDAQLTAHRLVVDLRR